VIYRLRVFLFGPGGVQHRAVVLYRRLRTHLFGHKEPKLLIGKRLY
jgi:hypothetical protein